MVLHSLKILGYCNLLKGSKHERLLFPRSKWRSPMHSLIQEISHRPVKHFLQYKLIELAVLFDHASSSIIFSYWIPKSIMELKQSSQLKIVFYKKLKNHWNIEGSLQFQNDSLSCVCQKSEERSKDWNHCQLNLKDMRIKSLLNLLNKQEWLF